MADRRNSPTTSSVRAQADDYTLEEVEAILSEVLGRKIAYQPAFARVGGGGNSGIFLSQLFYWSRTRAAQERVIDGKRGWVYKPYESDDPEKQTWYSETGMSRDDLMQARKECKARDLVEEKLTGNPATLHYRINFRRLCDLLTGKATYTPVYTPGKLRSLSNLEKRGLVSGKSKNTFSESRKTENSDFPETKSVENPETLNIQESTQVITLSDYARDEALSEGNARALLEREATEFYKWTCALIYGARSQKARRLLKPSQRESVVRSATAWIEDGLDLTLLPKFAASWKKFWKSRKGTERPTLDQVREHWVELTGAVDEEDDTGLERGSDEQTNRVEGAQLRGSKIEV